MKTIAASFILLSSLFLFSVGPRANEFPTVPLGPGTILSAPLEGSAGRVRAAPDPNLLLPDCAPVLRLRIEDSLRTEEWSAHSAQVGEEPRQPVKDKTFEGTKSNNGNHDANA